MVKTTQNSWLGGQLDWEMAGRQDVDKYKIGATELFNFLPMRRGSIVKRPGTDHICDVSHYLSPSQKFRILPFSYLKDLGFVLVFKDGAARVYCCQNRIPGFTDCGSGSYVDVVADDVIGYAGDELDEMCYCQCGDVVYIAHQNHPPAEVRHAFDEDGRHVFTFQNCPVNANVEPPSVTRCTIRRAYVAKGFRGGIHYEKYAASVVVLDKATGGEIESPISAVYGKDASVTTQTSYEGKEESGKMDYSEWAGTSYYLPWTESQVHTITVETKESHIGVKEVRLYKDSGGTWGLIASQRNADGVWDGKKSFTFKDNNIVPDTSVTPVEKEIVFDGEGEYPGTVSVYQQRLIWGSTRNNPARVWLSRSGDFYQYQAHRSLQVDDPIDFILPITRFAKINFIVELRKLIMFSDACEWLVGSNSDTSGITFETIMATAHSYIGCSRRLPPLICNNSILYAERTGQAVREYQYQIEGDIYGGTDISVFSSSIFDEKEIVDWTYQQHPNSTVWCVLSDGSMASLTYMKDQRVCAWATHALGGGGRVRGIATTHALFGGAGGNRNTEEVVVAVERGDAVVLERFRPFCRETDRPENCVVLDGARRGLVDGLDQVKGVEMSGYRFASRMTSVHPVLGSDVGNAQFDVKNVQYVHLRLQNSVGGSVRAIDMPVEQASTLVETKIPDADPDGNLSFAKIDERVLLEGSNNRDGRVVVEQDAPWPFQILLMECDIEVEEGGQR